MDEKQYDARIAKAMEDAAKRFDDAAEAEDETRSKELLAEGKKFGEEARRLTEILEARQKLRGDQERDAARRLSGTPERSFEGDAKREDNRRATEFEIPSEAALMRRSVAIQRAVRAGGVDKLSEPVAREATREWPVEDLFFDALSSRAHEIKHGTPTLVGEGREAWEAYKTRARAVQKRLTSPLTGGQLAGTAGAGAEFVPEAWSSDIIYNMAFYGGLNANRVRLFTNDTIGTYHVATVTDNETKRARILAEATASTKDRVTTSEKTLNPLNTVVQIPFTDQMLMGGNINLRGFIQRDVPEWFGRSINSWYWSGTGTNQPTGIDRIAKTASNRYQIATSKKVVESDMTNFIGLLDKAYLDLPKTAAMFHWGTILYLMTVRSGSTGVEYERVFPLSQDRKSVILPGGLMAEANNAITKLETGSGSAVTDTVGFVGDLDCYGAIMAGGMNVEMQRNLESLQFLLSWNFYQDGKTLNEQAFAFLQGR